jgi:hypothetical protein
MSQDLLRQDKVPTLNEIRFLLQLARDREMISDHSELALICQSHSINLGQSFENGIVILEQASLVQRFDANGIRITPQGRDAQLFRSDHLLCTTIANKLLEKFHADEVLPIFFNDSTIKFHINKDAILINISLMPLIYPMMKVFLLNMGIAYPDTEMRSRILIHDSYRSFFTDQVLKKVFKGSDTLDIITGASDLSEPEPKDDLRPELPVNGVKVFVSYSSRDIEYRNELMKHFSGLTRSNVIKLWYDGLIRPGEPWDATIKRNLENADYILFLISADFMASDYINDVEITFAIERHSLDQVVIIPIIARPCDHASLPIGQFQALPKGAKPIASWPNPDDAYLDIVLEFKKLLNQKANGSRSDRHGA